MIDLATSSTIYLVGKGGRIFKTTNGGENWIAANSGLPTRLRVNTLAIDPSNSTILYAGSMDGGIFKSTNGGGSWTPVISNLPIVDVNSLIIDPSSPSTVYAGTSTSFC